MAGLWFGSWATRARIGSGLILFTYVLFHFLNIGLGIFSPAAMDAMQDARQVVTRSVPGGLLLYGALLTHAALALGKIAMRRTLRMPRWEAVQLALGLLIPVWLLTHIVYTRGAYLLLGMNDEMGWIIGLIWGTQSGWTQALLLLITWIHGCAGLHFWLRILPWWQRNLPLMAGLATLVPAFALAGYLVEGRRLAAVLADPADRAALHAHWNWPDSAGFAWLGSVSRTALLIFAACLVLALTVHVARRYAGGRRSVRIRYVDGPEVSAPKGLTLLEISRRHGIQHTALCGGRGRCTTCRVVIEEGADKLHPPDETEQRSLRAVGAGPLTRLACQIRPTDALTVFRVFLPDGKRSRAHASQGSEEQLAILFLDMRGFTARTTGQLPYDVVFLLNRFFDAIVPAIIGAGGTIDKYLGDGLLAVFEAPDKAASAAAALRAAEGIGKALDGFNALLRAEGAAPVRIGVGLHLGELVLGEIGAEGAAPRTIIGAAVNTASRLEAHTKVLGAQMLVSCELLQAAGYDVEESRFVTLDLRGVDHPVRALAVSDLTALSGATAAG